MHYGNKPHIPSGDDLTILRCYCGWMSEEQTVEQMQQRGIPWYCDACGRPGLKFIRFAPSERAEARLRFGVK